MILGMTFTSKISQKDKALIIYVKISLPFDRSETEQRVDVIVDIPSFVFELIHLLVLCFSKPPFLFEQDACSNISKSKGQKINKDNE